MRIISINIGVPRTIEWNGRQVETSIFKSPVKGKVKVGRLNLEGDVQADKAAHGGEHRALMVYQRESYEFWRRKLLRNDLQFGQLGENLTVEGLADEDVCIGDRYVIGTAMFEVTQPRVTCFKVGISTGIPEMPALLVSQRRPGFYFRVIEEGIIDTGDEIIKIANGPERMSVADIDALLYSKDHPAEKLARALKIPALSFGWQGSFRELESAVLQGISGNAGLAARVQTVAWTGFKSLSVLDIINESKDVVSFKLGLPDGAALPTYLPGQHIAIRLRAGEPKMTVIRMYSLCGPLDAGYYRIAVKFEGGVGSSYLHKFIKKGESIDASAPRGNFIMSESKGPLILLSAGVGITPVLGMLYGAAAKDKNRSIWWLHSAQDGSHHSFAEEIKDLIQGAPHAKMINIYSRPNTEDRKSGNFDYEGRLDLRLLNKLNLPKNAECYICGPSAYIRDIESYLEKTGIGQERIFKELFENVMSSTNGTAPHLPTINGGTGPQVSFMKSKISFAWDNRFNSILEAVEACDIPVSWSCRTGVCHRCESNLVDGKIAYSPSPLDEPGVGNILICCARPTSDIILDL